MRIMAGKTVLFCRPAAESGEFKRLFARAGSNVIFFPTFKILYRDVCGDAETRARLEAADQYDRLIFSSVKGVEAFLRALRQLQLPLSAYQAPPVATVGNKAADYLLKYWPEAVITHHADSLQELLELLARQSPETEQSLLHPTSGQSEQQIPLRLPATIHLERLPLYETVPEDRYSPEMIRTIRSRECDVIVFSSPTTFDYFRQLVGDDHPLNRAALAVFGATTRRHIEQAGYPVSIQPEAPSPRALVEAVENYFLRGA